MKKKLAPKAKARGCAVSDVPHDFPRMLYHADGAQRIFDSKAEFVKSDDGQWATNPGVHGRDTCPGPKDE